MLYQKHDLPFCISLHKLKGSPEVEGGHVHDGMWLLTEHNALVPHAPGQGSTHLPLWHVRVGEHSPLVLHSNRHPL